MVHHPNAAFMGKKHHKMYAVFMREKRINVIENRIDKIKAELSLIGEIRPLSLNPRYKDKEKTDGPHYQLSYTHEKKVERDIYDLKI